MIGRSVRSFRYPLAIVAALLLVGGVAAASIPDSDGWIHGCRKNSDGSLRVIDTAVTTTCPNGYTSLNWPARDSAPGTAYDLAGQSGSFAHDGSGSYQVSCPDGRVAIAGSAWVNWPEQFSPVVVQVGGGGSGFGSSVSVNLQTVPPTGWPNPTISYQITCARLAS